MTTQPLPGYDPKRRERRDLVLFLLILIGIFACLMAAAQAAITQAGAWTVQANMLSELDPDGAYQLAKVAIEPLRPEVMTPPWSISRLLTPVGQWIVIPPLVPVATTSATATPLKGATPPSTPTVPPSERDTPTPQPRNQTPTAAVGTTSTATLRPLATATLINTPAATATRVPPSATATRAPTRVPPTEPPDRPTRVPPTDVPPTRPSRASATPAP